MTDTQVVEGQWLRVIDPPFLNGRLVFVPKEDEAEVLYRVVDNDGNEVALTD